jgi:imidazoleglycerol-phosphate dehydratase
MRKASIQRKTKETAISLTLNLQGTGKSKIMTGIGMLDHMLETFSKHGLFDIQLKAKGDLQVDAHHLLEDCGLCLGQAFKEALGDKKGIHRAGFFVYPMDEALAVVAVDLGGRPCLQFAAQFKRRYCGELDTDALEDFFQAFTVHCAANVVVRMPFGRSDHHKLEAIFKAFAKALKQACSLDPRALDDIPSTKGVIDQ